MGGAMVRTVVAWTGIVVAAGVSAVYLASTVLFLAPPNPLTLQMLPVIRGLHGPFFAQNWHLFAPNPIRTNFVLTVRCRVGDEVTAWHDPFTPVLARHHLNRFSPMGKIIRMPQGAIYLFLGRSSDEWRLLICRRAPEVPACRAGDRARAQQRAFGRTILDRLGSAACDDLVGYGRASHVQARILIHEPPPWSKRDLPGEVGSTKYLQLPWAGYQTRVSR